MLGYLGRSLIATAALVVGSAAQAGEVGLGSYDDSGDSGENPFYWCGERLWLEDPDGGVALIDPEIGKAIARPVARGEGHDRFWGCSEAGAETLILLDKADDGMGWITLNGKRGAIVGVAHGGGSTLSYPLIDFDENVVLAIAADGVHLSTPELPEQYRFAWLDASLLKPVLDLETAIALVRIGPGLFALEVPGDQILIEVDTTGPHPELGRHWRLSDLVPLAGGEYFLGYPKAIGTGIEVRAWRDSDFTGLPGSTMPLAQICRLQDLNRDPVKAACHAPSESERPLDDRIKAKLPNVYLSLSPSTRWTAWAVSADGENDHSGPVKVFIERTDLLPR